MALAVRKILTVLMLTSLAQAGRVHRNAQAQASAETGEAARITNQLSSRPVNVLAALFLMENPVAAFQSGMPQPLGRALGHFGSPVLSQHSVGAGSRLPVAGNMDRRGPRTVVMGMSSKANVLNDQSEAEALLKKALKSLDLGQIAEAQSFMTQALEVTKQSPTSIEASSDDKEEKAVEAKKEAAVEVKKDEAFGASHTSFYTNAVKKDKYDTLQEVLSEKMANKELVEVVNTMFDAIGTITEALREELVTVAEEQSSVFGDVQLGVDVLADKLMWDVCKTTPLIKEGASEEEPEVRQMNAGGKYSICWDPLDGSSIVDNNWAVGTIIGIWPASTGIIGATGRDQATSMVALYGPRTTVFIALDDGVYEFTYGANGVDGWLCSRERIEISPDTKIFAPANMRAAQEVDGYNKLLGHWMENRYTLRYSGGLVPDITQQFTKGMGIFANPTSKESPAKLRLAFEAAPFGFLVEKAGGKTSNGVDGGSILDTPITGIDQRTPLAIGSANEVDRFNDLVLDVKSSHASGLVENAKPEIEIKPMSKEDAESTYGISGWGTWGCDVSKFDWQYSGTEQAYILEGEVKITPTGAWAESKEAVVKAGDFVTFPDGMTCVWDVTKPIKKHYNFP